MENATKALLIAAAILIAIVLISIGVFVLRQGQDAMSAADMSEAEILAFNSKFESYSGTQRGSQVNALIERVVSANRGAASGTDITLTVNNPSITINQSTTAVTDAQKVPTANFYNVTMTKSTDGTGLIRSITVTKVQ